MEVDRGSQDPRLIGLAQEACRSCLQLPHCEEQRAGITAELRARGVGWTVIGAAATEAPPPPEEKAPPKDPSFTFNLQYPLTEPRHTLEVIRQGFRSGQLRAAGAPLSQQQTLTSYLSKTLAAEREGYGLTQKEVDVTAHIVSRSVLKYRLAAHPDWSRKELKGPLSSEERHVALEIQEAFAEDVAVLKKAGFLDPETLAQMHTPDFYDKIVQYYSQSFGISLGHIHDRLRKYTLNPVPAIESYIAKNRQQKQIGAQVSLGKRVTDVPPVDLPAKVRVREVMRKYGSSWVIYTHHLPELKGYLPTICYNNLLTPDQEVKEIFHTVKKLQGEHPTTDIAALVHLTYYRREDVEDAISTYETVLQDLQGQYPGHPALSARRLSRLAFTHLEEAPAFIEEYLQRLAKLQAACEAADSSLPENFLWHVAEYYKRECSVTELEALYKRTRLSQLSAAKLPGIERWIVGKVVELYEKDKYEEVLRHISRFLKRGYLVVAHLDSRHDALPTWYDPVDGKKGSYLALSDQFSGFSLDKQEAILASFGLDRIVLGYDADKARLCSIFGVPSIDQLVDEYLLPYSRDTDVNYKDPFDVLRVLRVLRRDKAYPGRKRDPKVQEDARKKLTVLLRQLAKDKAAGYDLSDPDCQDGLRRLLVQVRAAFPSVFRTSLVGLAVAYLGDARQAKELSCAKPFTIALGYSGAVCKNFFDSVGDEAWQPTTSHLSEMLRRNTTGQAIVELHRYQQRVQHFLPHFKNRNISVAILKTVCWQYPDEVADRLALYDQVVQVYSVNAMAHAIHYYCFTTAISDPISQIKEWRHAVSDVDTSYKRLFGTAIIKRLALGKRGKELVDALNDRVRMFHELSKDYARSPHPAIDDAILKNFAEIPSTAKKQLPLYIKRWEAVHTNPKVAKDIPNIDVVTLRRIVATNRVKPEEGIEAYLNLQATYKDDDYIDPSMIDEAVKWSVRQAAVSIRKLRSLLRKTEVKTVSLYKERRLKRGSLQALHEVIPDTKTPTPETKIMSSLVDPEAPTREQSQLMKLLSRLPNKECAAVAAVHQIPWLLPQDMQDEGWGEVDRVCEAFSVRDVDELEPIVERIITKLCA